MSEDTDFVMHPKKEKGEKSLPKKGIFYINPYEWTRCEKYVRNKGWKQRFIFNSNLWVSQSDDCFVVGPAIGAPMAVIVLEKLIALGAKEVTIFGWCGGLHSDDKVGDLVVVGAAVSGEGTSGYYSDDVLHKSSDALQDKLKNVLTSNEFGYRKGLTWSTDAPFRESKTQLLDLVQKENIDVVEMEMSALLAVAKLRQIDVVGLLLISDLPLAVNWTPGFKDKQFKSKSTLVVEKLIETKLL